MKKIEAIIRKSKFDDVVKALQEAQTRIETLETQNTAILARLDALEAG